MIVKTCAECGVTFHAKDNRVKRCSEACKKAAAASRCQTWAENNRERSREIKTSWRGRNPEYHSDYYKANKDTWADTGHAMQWYAEASEEAKRLKPLLDAIEFTPTNLPIIIEMAEYIEQDAKLAHLLDWYWLSDAKEYING